MTNHPTNTSLQGRKSKGRINTTLKSGKRRPQADQVREEKKKDEKTEKYSTNEKARKKLPVATENNAHDISATVLDWPLIREFPLPSGENNLSTTAQKDSITALDQ